MKIRKIDILTDELKILQKLRPGKFNSKKNSIQIQAPKGFQPKAVLVFQSVKRSAIIRGVIEAEK